MPTLEQVKFAAENLQQQVRRTELIASPYYSELLNVPLYFKCENLQHTGSFKPRGCYHFLSQQPLERRAGGVITASAGNHALGLAYAARLLDCPCRVVMPEGVPLAKELAATELGAVVEICGTDLAAAETQARQLAAEQQLLYVPAFDDELIMAGQGTIGLELLEQLPELETLVVPVGGGGLIAGIAATVCSARPSVRVIGVEPASAASAQLARRKGRPVSLSNHCHSLADGLAIRQVGAATFPLLETYVEEIVTVEEEAIAMAVVSLMEQGKLFVEGAGAVGLAAMLYGLQTIQRGPTVCLLSGGNLDLQSISRVVEQGMLAEGRYLKLRLEMIDMPGALAQLAQLLSGLGANIFRVAHDRQKSALPLGEAEVILDLETRGSSHVQEILLVLEEEGYRPEVCH